MFNTLTEFYERQEVKEDKIIDELKEDLKEQKKRINQMFKLLNESLAGLKKVDGEFLKRRIC